MKSTSWDINSKPAGGEVLTSMKHLAAVEALSGEQQFGHNCVHINTNQVELLRYNLEASSLSKCFNKAAANVSYREITSLKDVY